MINVFHLVSSLGISNGVMSVIMNYYRCMDKENIKFIFLYYKNIPKNETYINEILELGGILIYIGKPQIRYDYIFKISNIFKTNIISFKSDKNILHIHEIFLTFMFAPIAWFHGMKIITHAHSSEYSDRFFSRFRNYILCLPVNFLTDFKIACSVLAAQRYYGKKMVDRKCVYYLRNAIDIEKYIYKENEGMKIRKELGIENRFVIGHVGRFSKVKNHMFLIDIFSSIYSVNSNSFLLLIGDGELFEDVKDYVEKLHLRKNVLFLGNRNDVPKLLSSMNVFVFPSLHEGLPVSVVEAQIAGLHCIVSATITHEVDLGNITYLSLDKGADYWGAKIVKENLSKKIPSKSKTDLFDIKMQKKKIIEIYNLMV